MSKSLTSTLLLTSAVMLSLISACGKNDAGQQNELRVAQSKPLIQVPQSLFGKYGNPTLLTKYAACATEIEIGPYFDAKSQQNYLTSLASNPDKEDGHIEPNYYRAFQKTPKQIPDLKNIVSIAAGSNYSLALDKEGRVWGWGSKLYVFSQDLNFKQPTPKLITQDVNAVKVIGKAPSDFGLLLKTGNVKLWRKGVLFEPVIDNVVDVAMNYSNTYFLLSTGRVYALGTNYSGELGQRHKEEFKHPLLIKQIGHIIKIDTYSALDDKGRVWQWGREAGMSIDKIFSGTNGYVQYYPKVMLSNKNIRDISCCTAALAEDGTVWFWGDDSAGRRGDNKRPKGSYQLQTHRHWTTPVRSLWRWK